MTNYNSFKLVVSLKALDALHSCCPPRRALLISRCYVVHSLIVLWLYLHIVTVVAIGFESKWLDLVCVLHLSIAITVTVTSDVYLFLELLL